MKKRIIIAGCLMLLLTTISTQQRIVLEKFNLKKIIIKNNKLIQEREIKNSLRPIYNKNLIFLKNTEIQKILIENSFIDSFIIKKKYPQTLIIEIFEKKPIGILINNRDKFYISDKIQLIDFKKLPNLQNLPTISGNREAFEKIYNNLIKINFPMSHIKKFIFLETNRWDLKTINDDLIKLPSKNYVNNLKNYLNLMNSKDIKKYNIFDYRIENQLILK